MKEVVLINKTLKIVIVLIFIIAIVNIVYYVFQISTLINPYIKFMFPDIKSNNEIFELYNDNKKEIQDIIAILNKLPYKEISIDDWLVKQDNTIYADGQYISIDETHGGKQILAGIYEGLFEHIQKKEDVIYIVTDTAKDYSKGIAWLKTGELVFPTKDIHYIKQISDNFWIFEEHTG